MNDIVFLSRPEGRIAYTVQGDGPLVVAVPGMGDLRGTYRDLVTPLVGAGYRVAVMDLRGHGDSDTTFAEHGDIVTGQDALALVEALGGPAVLVGNSMGAAAVTWAAAERVDLVRALVLTGPILREPAGTPASALHLLYRLLFAGPWGAGVWASYYRSLNRGTRAAWLDAHVADIRAAMKQPGRLRSFRHLTLQLDHSPVERRVGELAVPAIAFLGDGDPDYKDVSAERDWLQSVGIDARIVPSAGHYPHAQRPDLVAPAVLEFLHERVHA